MVYLIMLLENGVKVIIYHLLKKKLTLILKKTGIKFNADSFPLCKCNRIGIGICLRSRVLEVRLLSLVPYGSCASLLDDTVGTKKQHYSLPSNLCISKFKISRRGRGEATQRIFGVEQRLKKVDISRSTLSWERGPPKQGTGCRFESYLRDRGY